jgi:hypothetical protein
VEIKLKKFLAGIGFFDFLSRQLSENGRIAQNLKKPLKPDKT